MCIDANRKGVSKGDMSQNKGVWFVVGRKRLVVGGARAQVHDLLAYKRTSRFWVDFG